jgi:hypothetical protein
MFSPPSVQMRSFAASSWSLATKRTPDSLLNPVIKNP